MIRIIGILCGSAIAIAFLIVALGVPEFLPSSEVADTVAAPPEIVTLDSAIESEIESMPPAAPPA
jgi:hypothetical protein